MSTTCTCTGSKNLAHGWMAGAITRSEALLLLFLSHVHSMHKHEMKGMTEMTERFLQTEGASVYHQRAFVQQENAQDQREGQRWRTDSYRSLQKVFRRSASNACPRQALASCGWKGQESLKKSYGSLESVYVRSTSQAGPEQASA